MRAVRNIPSDHDIDAFYHGARSDRIPLVCNDIVRIKIGPHTGEEGWIVGLAEPGQNGRYTVELCSGRGDLDLRALDVELVKGVE